jgi:hypothetical protein
MSTKINFQLEYADIKEFEADILVLKYAQLKYGVDRLISDDLVEYGVKLNKISPGINKSTLIDNVGTSSFKKILFIGVSHINDFGYQEIKRFATQSLDVLKESAPETEHIAMTIHGVGYGLDENEALLSQLAGLFEGIQRNDFPQALKRISIIEHNYERVLRLQSVLDSYLKNQSTIKGIESSTTKTFTVSLNSTKGMKATNGIQKILSIGKALNNKKHIFVAMPFKKEMYDTFYYGIQKPIHHNKFLCERIDEDTFTGDILAKMKSKIETSSAVIADLSLQNPNVYLEIGYAWGIKKPTILLIRKGDDIKFDVQGQRCLQYEGIKHLEEILTKEIKGLIKNGEIGRASCRERV